MKRFEEGHGLTDLDTTISSDKESLRLTPNLDPEQGMRLADLGAALWTRFKHTGQMVDINKACICFERSLLNEPVGARRCR